MIALDKAFHFLAGFGVAAILLPFLGLWAVAISVVVGLAKEAYDATGRGTVEFADFVWTAGGGVVALAMSVGLHVLVRIT